MALSEYATSLLATFSLLAATISSLISPNVEKSFFRGVKWNIWLFSPFRSGAIAMAVVILLIAYRLLNLAETHVGLALLVLHPTSDARSGRVSHGLLFSPGDYDVINQTVLVELSTFSCVTTFEVRGGWPRRVLVEGSVLSAAHLIQDYVDNEGKESGSRKRNEHRKITSTPAVTGNLCDRVRQLSPIAAEPDITSASHSFLLEQSPKLRRVFDPSVPAQCQIFQDLAEAAPIVHQVLKALLIHSISGVLSYYGSRSLILWAIGLTQENFSCIIEIIVIAALYFTVYCLAVRSDQAPSKPHVAPDNNYQGTHHPYAGVSETPDEKEERPRAESEFPQTPNTLRSEIFRLAVVVPTLTI
ncbi:hypothetical protein N7537_010468 [Penicillium hordei]|uniref:Uncharacterized protein n=1 Tax=Penicillium hordei TaxID=40994 RepID=A0AAD6GYU5_9EURO|nr:uncharacterized protein N7537_010468 [Penicillium hordei]KAJ5593564.1 hypothetical protein N7537_010468 [Penicillium hordei]